MKVLFFLISLLSTTLNAKEVKIWLPIISKTVPLSIVKLRKTEPA